METVQTIPETSVATPTITNRPESSTAVLKSAGAPDSLLGVPSEGGPAPRGDGAQLPAGAAPSKAVKNEEAGTGRAAEERGPFWKLDASLEDVVKDGLRQLQGGGKRQGASKRASSVGATPRARER